MGSRPTWVLDPHGSETPLFQLARWESPSPGYKSGPTFEAAHERLRTTRCASAQDAVHPEWSDLSEVEAQEKPKRDPTAPKRIGFVGQLISRKNVRDLLHVFDELHARHPETELVILGDGDQRSDLEAHALTLASKDSIEFLGFRNDRLELLKSFDLFAMTSTLEGIPRCLMEATAAEIPVAAYDIPGIDQLVTHEETGLLAPLGDRQQLLQHWESILFDSDKANGLAAAAKQFVYENYSAQRMAREYTSLFKELADHSVDRK